MSAPINPDSPLYTAGDAGYPSAHPGYSPSVPISVYRELATELKTTQLTLDALTQQNQQLLRQNKLLRTEIQRFVKAAEQLGHFAGVVPAEVPAPPAAKVAGYVQEHPATAEMFVPRQAPVSEPAARPEQSGQRLGPESVTQRPPKEPVVVPQSAPFPEEDLIPDPFVVPQSTAIVPHPKERKRDRANPPQPASTKQRFFTEQPEGMHPLSRIASRSDMGNLWLATTILLVVVSAFGAGFLIMRPLLNNR